MELHECKKWFKNMKKTENGLTVPKVVSQTEPYMRDGICALY